LKSDLYAGIAILRRAHDPSAAKKKLAEAGYGGEPIVVIAPTELAGIRALSLIGADQLRRAKHRTLATPSARPGRVQTPWTSSNTAAPANTITDVAAAPVKKPTAQSSARSRN
jgi:hypothetical protein